MHEYTKWKSTYPFFLCYLFETILKQRIGFVLSMHAAQPSVFEEEQPQSARGEYNNVTQNMASRDIYTNETRVPFFQRKHPADLLVQQLKRTVTQETDLVGERCLLVLYFSFFLH